MDLIKVKVNSPLMVGGQTFQAGSETELPSKEVSRLVELKVVSIIEVIGEPSSPIEVPETEAPKAETATQSKAKK